MQSHDLMLTQGTIVKAGVSVKIFITLITELLSALLHLWVKFYFQSTLHAATFKILLHLPEAL